MNKKINPKNILKKISGLPTDEQFLKSLREQLADYMKNTPPLIKIKNPEKLFGARSFSFKMPAVLGLIVILLSSGATALASQKSLPGETLYPVKLLTEDISLVVTLNSEAKIELLFQPFNPNKQLKSKLWRWNRLWIISIPNSKQFYQIPKNSKIKGILTKLTKLRLD